MGEVVFRIMIDRLNQASELLKCKLPAVNKASPIRQSERKVTTVDTAALSFDIASPDGQEYKTDVG